MAIPRIIIFLCLSLVSFSVSADGGSAAHDELIKYGFPIGLLPSNVENYTINRTSGVFSIILRDSCRVTLPPDNYLATYSRKISGKIVENRIAELDGINVRAFFKWWGITGIKSNGQDLVFEVGVVSAKYPSKNFDISPLCEGTRSSS
ncbi:hypothetical protein ABFS82_10G109200 [Erythranthe guttata]|uniref:DUF538 domain-containing protein n=1 Tax=Erythranthe guttata TaxID=4155 RepID=A0A022QM39_ERYGU|nr:PREDICTED: uncharacterized protein LOC105966457 [Erythranthe guttata]XP_012846465.1 PREDICTED: uncharacterized protein LOC105966457 [Erythranthe guttata]EYU29772.1 hypothetical protein MIMGU_mgv1a015752mg [Erythranthe guttata]EYU29773.1 hypothetical protein MIMGU_mgv1a015752mg [Erythranthe guttata]|eukprot:XP_012846464.1 PREDICTED: uncharacterized protein LOC105966457 [Erythranthe guttata]